MIPKTYGDMLQIKNNKKDGRFLKEQPSLTSDLSYQGLFLLCP
jgi:hypothetical protein